MVFQHLNLFPHMNVMRNLCEPAVRVRKEPHVEVEERAKAMLKRVGLEDKATAYPKQLSGGEQQRVAIARALTMRPKLLLLDEPTSALDPELVNEVLMVIRDVASTGLTMIVVTHEMGFAREVADEICFMDRGRLVEQGLPGEFFDRPRSERAQAFLSKLI
jgi:polar amino acid transport system ATP-binding protein